MNTSQLNLPIPTGLSRQIGISDLGSPIVLSRGSSIGSLIVDTRSPEDRLRDDLLNYKTSLEHDIDFIETEIAALSTRDRIAPPEEEALLDELHEGLKVRFNLLQTRLAKVTALLDVM